MAIRIGLIVLCGLGLSISLYFTMVYFKVMKPDQWFVPRVCRMEEGTCSFIIRTPDARIFGLPNFVLGLLYYTALIAVNIASSTQAHELLYQLLSAVSVGTVLLGVYLTYSLLFKLKTNCVLCFTSHIVNAVIMILLIIQLTST